MCVLKNKLFVILISIASTGHGIPKSSVESGDFTSKSEPESNVSNKPSLVEYLKSGVKPKTVALSDEHSIDYYVNVENVDKIVQEPPKEVLRGCEWKVQHFCEKQCRRAYRNVCNSYRCRSRVKYDFERACDHHCQYKERGSSAFVIAYPEK